MSVNSIHFMLIYVLYGILPSEATTQEDVETEDHRCDTHRQQNRLPAASSVPFVLAITRAAIAIA